MAKGLRKKYWFPIRLNVRVKSCSYFLADSVNDIDSDADFIHPLEGGKRVEFPSIWISIGKYEKDLEKRSADYAAITFFLVHEITHYYQWYFFQMDTRSK